MSVGGGNPRVIKWEYPSISTIFSGYLILDFARILTPGILSVQGFLVWRMIFLRALLFEIYSKCTIYRPKRSHWILIFSQECYIVLKFLNFLDDLEVLFGTKCPRRNYETHKSNKAKNIDRGCGGSSPI